VALEHSAKYEGSHRQGFFGREAEHQVEIEAPKPLVPGRPIDTSLGRVYDMKIGGRMAVGSRPT
jgi:hypothetical protein